MRQFVKMVVLVALIGIIAVVNVYMMREPVSISPTLNSQRGTAQLASAGGGETEYVAAFGDLSFVQSFSRPLFSEDRRKYQPPKAKPKPVAKKPTVRRKVAAVEPPEIKLVGLSVAPTSSRALIMNSSTNETTWISVGENIQGWDVTAIDDNSLIMENRGEKISINLHPSRDGS